MQTRCWLEETHHEPNRALHLKSQPVSILFLFISFDILLQIRLKIFPLLAVLNNIYPTGKQAKISSVPRCLFSVDGVPTSERKTVKKVCRTVFTAETTKKELGGFFFFIGKKKKKRYGSD